MLAALSDYADSHKVLWASGNKAALKAVDYLKHLMGEGIPPDDPRYHLKYSDHGESRIKHCKKFRPTRDTRLVTVFEQGIWVVCYVGLEPDANQFCEKYTGHRIEHQNGKWFLVPETKARKYKTDNFQFGESKQGSNLYQPAYTPPVVDKLPPEYKKKFIKKICKNNKDVAALVNGYTGGNFPEELTDIPGITEDDLTQIWTILHALTLDGNENLDEAKRTIDGGTKPLDGTGRSNIKESSSQIQIIHDVDDWLSTLNKAATSNDWKEWMTLMHPDQQKIVDKDYPGPVYLKGVSGSGKTAIIVNRAERLAKKYPEEKILIVTLNRSLAKLIQKLISTKCPELKNIEVDAFFNICRNRLKDLGHDLRLFDDKSDVHGIHVDEIWDRYYLCEENNRDAASFFEFHDQLISEGHSINAKNYIRDELDWVRSAFQPSKRDAYVNATRKDRKIRLDQNKGKREPILQGLSGWEEKLAFVGVTDYLNLSSQLSDPSNLDLLTPIYRAILIDEAQDFGTTELTIIRRLAADNENDLFFSGDSAQKISHKYQDFSAAEINIKHNPMPNAEKNYRNTREIIVYANNVLEKYNKAHHLNIDIIKPEATNRNGPNPILLNGDNHSAELTNAITYLKHLSNNNSNSKYCIAICGHTEYELYSYAQEIGFPVLDGSATLDDDAIFISDLENTKGFEFDTVIITNCSDTCFPPRYSSEDDKIKNISRLYVAMTRAKHELIISFSGRASDYVSDIEQIELQTRSNSLTNFMASHRIDMQDFADADKIENIKKLKNFSDEIYKEAIVQLSSKSYIKWDDFLAESKIIGNFDSVGDVKSLEQLKQDRKRIGEMNFEQFLFTEFAIGLPKDLVRILRKTSNTKLSILHDEINSPKFRVESGLNTKPELYRKLYDRIEHIKSLNLY